jgi:hypothetical protein
MVEYGPGSPLYNYGPPYGFEKHLNEYGNGTNRLRTHRLAQVGALKSGDILANGAHVWSDPREGGNGITLLHLDIGGEWFGTWYKVPPRIPIALFTKDNIQKAVKKGDILATGELVFSDPDVRDNGVTYLDLAEGAYRTLIDVPSCIPIATLIPEDNAPKALWEYHKK